MNKTILMGRLTRDPETRYSQGENSTAITRFSLAVDRKFPGNDGVTADFFNCTAFGKKAEFIEKYFRQGMKALVTGRIQNDNYTKQDGTKVYSVGIIAEDVEFCESKSNSSDSNYSRPDPSNASDDGFCNIPDGIAEELPFNTSH